MSANNNNLSKAKDAKNDEFYTRIEDIEAELRHYRGHFKNKTVLLNCDDPEWSNFWKFFELNFEFLGLKKLISTHFEQARPSYKLEISGDVNGDGRVNGLDTIKTPLEQNGDFRSPECEALLEEADIVVTNPPFSLFREYIDLLVKHNKKFLVIGSQNAITYKEVFPHIRDNKMWLGVTAPKVFTQPDGEEKKFGNICWFTNLAHYRRNEERVLFREYRREDYPNYDNYDAIEVAKAKDIPVDYAGVMGVPITFLNDYMPDQFEILGVTQSWDNTPLRCKVYPRQEQVSTKGEITLVTKLNDGAAIKVESPPEGKTYYRVDGEMFKKVYARILIQYKTR